MFLSADDDASNVTPRFTARRKCGAGKRLAFYFTYFFAYVKPFAQEKSSPCPSQTGQGRIAGFASPSAPANFPAAHSGLLAFAEISSADALRLHAQVLSVCLGCQGGEDVAVQRQHGVVCSPVIPPRPAPAAPGGHKPGSGADRRSCSQTAAGLRKYRRAPAKAPGSRARRSKAVRNAAPPGR